MALISEVLTNLAGGVSQRVPRLRLPSQHGEQINGLSSRVRGLTKRPPLEFVDTLSNNPAAYGDNALVETFQPDADSRYQITVAGGVVSAYDLDPVTGGPVPVHTPDGEAYLVGTDGFRMVKVGDTLWVLNRSKVIRRKDEKSPVGTPTGLLYIRQTDFSTQYTAVIDGTKVSTTTEAGHSAADRALIDTGKVAERFLAALVDKLGTEFKFVLYGSTISVERRDGTDFSMSGSDGLADRGLVVVKDSIQQPQDLPPKAPNGFIVKVAGDPGSEYDDFWIKFSDSKTSSGEGVWEETARPGTHTELDASTMPHQLSYLGAYEGPVEAGGHPTVPGPETDGLDVQQIYWSNFSNDLGVLINSGDSVNYTIPSEFSDETRTIRVGYNFETELMTPGSQVSVELQIEAGGIWSTLTSRIHWAGDDSFDQWLEVETTLPSSSAPIRLTINHSVVGDTCKVSPFGTMSAQMEGYTDNPTHFAYTEKSLDFGEEQLYPEAWGVSVVVDGTAYNYTTPGERDGAQVASALAALMAYGTADGAVLRITRQDGTQPTVTATSTWGRDSHIYSPEFDLAADQYVDKRLVNTTTGASGIIADSIGGLIVVTGGLSGGTRNTVRRGDKLEIQDTGSYFMFRKASWDPRDAGDDDLTPFPSFEDWQARDIFFHEGRLGLAAGDTAVFSEAGNHLNWFRQSARQLLANDPIDLASAGSENAEFHKFLKFNNGAYLVSEAGPFSLTGDPMLTPTTISLSFAGRYENHAECPPIVVGDRAFFARATERGVDLTHVYVKQNRKIGGIELTEHIPTYIPGEPLEMVADNGLGLLFLRTTADTESLWVLAWGESGEGYSMLSWSKWVFPTGFDIVGMNVVDGVLTLTTKDAFGAYLSTVTLKAQEASAADKTRFVDQAGSAANTVPYEFRVELTPIMKRGQDGVPDAASRLNLNYVELYFSDTTDFTVTVTPQGRDPKVHVHASSYPDVGVRRIPIRAEAQTTTITITDNTPGRTELYTLAWEGIYYRRPQRI